MSKLPFLPKIFFKVFAIILVLLLAGFALAYWIFRELTTTDIVGACISAVILTYLVHLWLIPSEERPGDGQKS